MARILGVVFLLLAASLGYGQPRMGPGAGIVNSPAPTPMMGFNFWTYFLHGGRGQTDQMMRDIADAMVSKGLSAAGYQYVGLDATWNVNTRTPAGNLFPDTGNFPFGMKPLVDYVHSKGLKFGIYIAAWPTGCAGDLGTWGHEVQDAAQFAAWGADLLKLDTSCNQGQITGDPIMLVDAATARMARALAATGRNITLMTGCGGGCDKPGGGFQVGVEYRTFYANGAQYVRVGTDMSTLTWAQLATAFTANAGINQFGGPNHWLDQDCLLTGEGVTDTEGQTSMSLWAIQAAPLLFGADIRVASSPSAATIASLTNSDVIAVDQDALGITGLQVSSVVCGSATCQVWAKPLVGTNTCAIGLFNLDSAAHDITATFATVAATFATCGSGPYTTARDLWAHASLGTLTTSYTATAVPAHGVAMIKVSP